MRKVVVYELLSLDGVAESPERFFTEWDAVMDANLAEVISDQDAVVLGRRSFDEWAQFWPTSDVQPFADFINAVPKFVATSSPLQHEWSDSSVIDGDVVEALRALKSTSGGAIGVHASISLARALFRADVVDELRLVVAPRTAGAGRRLFDGVGPIDFEMQTCANSPTGYVLLTYTRSRVA